MVVRALYALSMIVAFIGGVLVPCPAAVERDYVATGTLHIASDGPERQVCELRIGNATDAKRKLLIVSESGMAIAQACRDHAGDHASLTVRFAPDLRRAARGDGQ